MANYGEGDASFQAAGQRDGVARLVQSFYGHMGARPDAVAILAMHNEDLSVSIKKLTVFLAGWLGGPKEYAATFGPIRIPAAHAHLAIDETERDAWMACMSAAVNEQTEWNDDFKIYFMEAIAVPAERVRRVSVARRDKDSAP